MRRFDLWWIIVVLSLFAASAFAEENDLSVGFVGLEYQYRGDNELVGVVVLTCEACVSREDISTHLVFEEPAAVRVYYSSVSKDFVLLPLSPSVWVKRKVVKQSFSRKLHRPHENSEVLFLGSVGAAGLSGYETPILGTSADANLRFGRFAVLVGAGWDPQARKVGVGDGWSRNYGAGFRTYFKRFYFVQLNISRTEQFTSRWQKQATWIGGSFGCKTLKNEVKFGIAQDIESFNEVLALTFGARWYFPLDQSKKWGITAGFAGSISRFNQQRNGEWLRLTAANIDGLGGFFFRF